MLRANSSMHSQSYLEVNIRMVKQTTVKNSKMTNSGKSNKTQKKRVNKIVVQIRRVPSTEKITKVRKSIDSKKNDNKQNQAEEKPKRKYRKKKKSPENGEKLKFSIVDYLRTSMSDKLSADEVKKLKKAERIAEKKAKKLNGKIMNKSKDPVDDFGNYELLDNDPDDFMIPLDVVISDSAPVSEDDAESPKDGNSGQIITSDMDLDFRDSEIEGKVSEFNDEISESNNEFLDADILRSAYKNVLEVENVEPKKNPKGTHFLLTDASDSKCCVQCGASFTCAYKLRRHMLSHSDERKFFCKTCGSGFKTNYHLSRHMTNVHYIVDLHSCDLCDKEFTSRVSLKEHKLDQHPSKVSHFCSTCQKSYASRKGLKRHQNQIHVKK
ncbi:uncharacterized protein [Bemisia tabaci]